MSAKTAVIIPARYGSTRFPGKALADLCGKPLIRHVWERASAARCAGGGSGGGASGGASGAADGAVGLCAVATDDERIAEVVRSFGGRVLMTSASHRSGTDRLAEAASILGLARSDLVVNVQGDEPLVDPADVDLLAGLMQRDGRCQMGTLACPLRAESDATDPNVVKVVVDAAGYALYFSRSLIPGRRPGGGGAEGASAHGMLAHVGMYAYRVGFLRAFAAMEPGRLEEAEGLEQLRALERGFRIAVGLARGVSLGVDTPDDLREVERLLSGAGAGAGGLEGAEGL